MSIACSLVASHMESTPLTAAWKNCSARVHMRVWYDVKLQWPPVSACLAMGAMTMKAEAVEQKEESVWIESDCISWHCCGMEM